MGNSEENWHLWFIDDISYFRYTQLRWLFLGATEGDGDVQGGVTPFLRISASEDMVSNAGSVSKWTSDLYIDQIAAKAIKGLAPAQDCGSTLEQWYVSNYLYLVTKLQTGQAKHTKRNA